MVALFVPELLAPLEDVFAVDPGLATVVVTAVSHKRHSAAGHKRIDTLDRPLVESDHTGGDPYERIFEVSIGME